MNSATDTTPARVLATSVAACLAAMLAGCGAAASKAPAETAAPPVTSVQPVAETAPSSQDDGNDVAFWLDPDDPARSLVLSSAGTGGLEVHALDGSVVSRSDVAQIDHVDVRAGFDLGGDKVPLIVGYDRASRGLVAFVLDPASRSLRPVSKRTLPTDVEITGLCLYRSVLTGQVHAFAATDDGMVQQWVLRDANGQVDGRLVRTLPVGVGAGYCVADDATGTLYVTEETVGIWRYAAEPETDPTREAVDLAAPWGGLAGEVKGLTLYRADADRAWLVAADVEAARFNVYALDGAGLAGRVTIDAADGIDGVGESEGIAATSLALNAAFPGGALALVDEENDGAAMNVKLVSWNAIAQALSLPAGPGIDPREVAPPTANTVMASVETEPVEDHGDAADDPAIWVHPTNPARSLIIGTNKKRGLDVYDLSGKRVQSVADGRMNNVDLRDGFRLGGRDVTLVAATNRTDKSLALYAIDSSQPRLVNVAARTIPTELADPYGLCMYRSVEGEFYVFANDGDDGLHRQWRLFERDGTVDAERVRDIVVGSQAEGCVADDETGALYIAEEDVGLWRYSAAPDADDTRVSIDTVEGGRLTDDAEGISLYDAGDGRGWLVLSNQGADNYAVYRREGDNEFVGFVSIVANDELGIDGASETDGLDVTSRPLGPDFPRGALVVQDGRNLSPVERQNFKVVPWERIEAALALD